MAKRLPSDLLAFFRKQGSKGGRMTAAHRFFVAGLLCLGIAAAAYGALHVTLGPAPAVIHVRWAPGVDDTIRRDAEQRYDLSEGERLEGRTWAYTLNDPSRTKLRSLVGDAVIEDTHEIDRLAFRVSPTAPRLAHPPTSTPWIPVGLRVVTVLCLFIGLIGISLGFMERTAPGTTVARLAPRQGSVVPLLPRERNLVLLLLGILLALDVASMRHMTITNDEPNHYEYGQNVLDFDSTRLLNATMPLQALNALPAKVATQLPPGPLATTLGRIETGRYATVLFSLVVALCVFQWTRQLYGPAAGLLALTLYTFDPNLLAHSQLITADLFAVGTITFALYFFWRFLQLGGWKRAVGSALMLGLAQIAKYTAVALFPLFAVIAVGFHARELWQEVRERRVDALRRRAVVFSGVALVFVLLSFLVINVGFLFNRTLTPLEHYPFKSVLFRSVQSSAGVVGALPLPVPYPYVEGLDWVVDDERTGSSHGNIYLLGETRQGEGFAGYFFYACLYKLPLATQFLLLAAGVAYVARRRRFDFLRGEAVLFWPILFFTIYFNFFYRSQVGIRYILVVFPLLYILCGSLLAKGIALTKPITAALSTVIGGLVLSVLSYYPHFLPYFNELIRDRTQAYTVLADSNIDWGQNGWYLDQYRATHPGLIVEPDTPTAGTILVGVNRLTGVLGDPDEFRWLREHFMPVDHVAHATLVYRISESDLERIGQEPGER